MFLAHLQNLNSTAFSNNSYNNNNSNNGKSAATTYTTCYEFTYSHFQNIFLDYIFWSYTPHIEENFYAIISK